MSVSSRSSGLETDGSHSQHLSVGIENINFTTDDHIFASDNINMAPPPSYDQIIAATSPLSHGITSSDVSSNYAPTVISATTVSSDHNTFDVNSMHQSTPDSQVC